MWPHKCCRRSLHSLRVAHARPRFSCPIGPLPGRVCGAEAGTMRLAVPLGFSQHAAFASSRGRRADLAHGAHAASSSGGAASDSCGYKVRLRTAYMHKLSHRRRAAAQGHSRHTFASSKLSRTCASERHPSTWLRCAPACAVCLSPVYSRKRFRRLEARMLGNHKARLASPLHPRFFSSQLRGQAYDTGLAPSGSKNTAQQQPAHGFWCNALRSAWACASCSRGGCGMLRGRRRACGASRLFAPGKPAGLRSSGAVPCTLQRLRELCCAAPRAGGLAPSLPGRLAPSCCPVPCRPSASSSMDIELSCVASPPNQLKFNHVAHVSVLRYEHALRCYFSSAWAKKHRCTAQRASAAL